MKRIQKISLLLILILSTPGWIFSQDKSLETALSEKEDPVVALVLAGGGALGFAHVGVIKILEEEGIRPDIILGASIGSIIGGLYAAGYSADELEGVINDTDWKYTLTDSYVRSELSFEQKERQARYHISVGNRAGNNVSDAGFSHAQHVVELLDNLLAPYTVNMNFDDLPIPFRAIGTDLLTGEEIVYGSGDLKTVIRASMAVPGVFTPVVYQGRYVIDGGWSQNLPAIEAREMGADIVIAVSLYSMEDDIEKLTSLSAVNSQANQIRTLKRQQASLEAADLVISPDLTGYSMADFEDGRPLMALGFEAAEKMREEIRSLADEIGPRHDSPVQRKSADQVVHISDLRVLDRADDTAEKNLQSEMEEFVGGEFSLQDLRNRIYSFYDRGDYTHVWYQLEPAAADSYTLIVDAPPLTMDYERISTAFNFSSQMIESNISDFTLKTAYQRWFGEENNYVSSLELWLSNFPSLVFGLEHTIPEGRLHTGFDTYFLSHSRYFFDDNTVDSLYGLQSLGACLFVERPFFEKMDISLQLYGDYNWTDKRLGNDIDCEESWMKYGGKTVITIDTLDRIITPKKGRIGAFMLDYSIDEKGAPLGLARAAGEVYLPLTKDLVLIPKAEAQGLFYGELNKMEQPSLGESIAIHGYYPQELCGENVAMFGLAMRKQIASLPLGIGNEVYLQFAANVATIWEDGALDTYESFHYYKGAAAGFVVNSLLGELQLNFALNEDGRFSTFLGVSTSPSFLDSFEK